MTLRLLAELQLQAGKWVADSSNAVTFERYLGAGDCSTGERARDWGLGIGDWSKWNGAGTRGRGDCRCHACPASSCPHVPASPCPPVPPSPCLRVSLCPCLRVSASPRPPVPVSPRHREAASRAAAQTASFSRLILTL
jgi:hypothetical protein